MCLSDVGNQWKRGDFTDPLNSPPVSASRKTLTGWLEWLFASWVSGDRRWGTVRYSICYSGLPEPGVQSGLCMLMQTAFSGTVQDGFVHINSVYDGLCVVAATSFSREEGSGRVESTFLVHRFTQWPSHSFPTSSYMCCTWLFCSDPDAAYETLTQESKRKRERNDDQRRGEKRWFRKRPFMVPTRVPVWSIQSFSPPLFPSPLTFLIPFSLTIRRISSRFSFSSFQSHLRCCIQFPGFFFFLLKNMLTFMSRFSDSAALLPCFFSSPSSWDKYSLWHTADGVCLENA